MPKILITGNGFDLFHGLPTLYEDFIKTLRKIEEVNKVEIDYTYYFKANQQFNDIIFNDDNINKIKDLLNNKWYLCFKNELDIDTWIDFETKLEEVLKVIWYFIKTLNENVFSSTDLYENANLSYTDNFVNKVKYINILKYFGLIKDSISGNRYFNCVNEYGKIINGNFTELDDEKISKFLIKEWNQFIEIFDLYLNTFVTPLVDLSNNSALKFNGVDYYYTFNYSNVFEKLYNTSRSNYIHGKLSSSDSKNSIVLGFNDVEENLTNKKFYIPFTKFFQKLQKDTDFKFLNNIPHTNREPIYFYFFGHSLDTSDIEYIREVFDKIKLDRRSVVKIFTRSESSKDKLLLNLTNILGRIEITDLMKRNQIVFLNMQNQTINTELGIKMHNQNFPINQLP